MNVAIDLASQPKLVERLQGLLHCIVTCDEEEGEDGLCDCARAIGQELLLTDRTAYQRGLRAGRKEATDARP